MTLQLKHKALIAAVAVVAVIALLVLFLRPNSSGDQLNNLPLAQMTNADSKASSATANNTTEGHMHAMEQKNESAAKGSAEKAEKKDDNPHHKQDTQQKQNEEPTVKYAEVAKEFGGPKRDPNDPLAIGRVDAPIVLLDFSDYRCPFCGLFHKETFGPLVKEYVDTGKMRVEWRDLVVNGKESEDAAVAARAAGEQGKFWEYNHAVFQRATRGHQPLPKHTLLEIARQVNIPDMQRFERDMESQALRDLVLRDRGYAATMRLNATPSFVIGTFPFSGAQSIERFREIINANLRSAEAAKK